MRTTFVKSVLQRFARQFYNVSIVLYCVSSAHQVASATGPSLALSAEGISLSASADGHVTVFDGSGRSILTLTDYLLTWSPEAAIGGDAAVVVLPDGGKALQIACHVKYDPSGKVKIRATYTLSKNRAHVTYDVIGPSDLKADGAMLWYLAKESALVPHVARCGLWTRSSPHGAPYETQDVNLIEIPASPRSAFLALHGNPDWHGTTSAHFPAIKLGNGHFVAEGDIVLSAQGAEAAAAALAGRKLALTIRSNQVYNLWSTNAKPLTLYAHLSSLLPGKWPSVLAWKARDYDGKVLASGENTWKLNDGEAAVETISIPAPNAGIVFVEATASNSAGSVLCCTSVAVLPAHEFMSDTDSMFGLSAYFPLPTELDAEALLKRIGVRWNRSTQISAVKARELGIQQNRHVSMPPSGKIDAFDTDPAKKSAWIDGPLAESEQQEARYLELFNEWNMDGGVGKGKWAKIYADLWLKPFAQSRIRQKLRVKMMSMGLAGFDEGFLDGIYTAGAWPCFDALAIHTGRGWYTPDYGGKEQSGGKNVDYWNFLGSIESANALLGRYGTKELWITEAYASTAPNNAWTDTFRHAAENVVLSYALAAANGVRVMDWYQLNDSVWYDQGGVNATDVEYHFGLLNRDLSPKPSLLGYETIAAALDGGHFVRAIKPGDSRSRGLLFETPRGPMAVLWDRSDGYLLNTSHGAKATDFTTPEPWIDEWKTKVKLSMRAVGPMITEIDCIGRTRTILSHNGMATVILDGAPRIYYGLDTKALK